MIVTGLVGALIPSSYKVSHGNCGLVTLATEVAMSWRCDGKLTFSGAFTPSVALPSST